MKKILDDLRSFFMDWLYPRDLTCLLCNETTDDVLCSVCYGSIQFNVGSCCNACGRMIHHASYHVCQNCIMLDRHFDCGLSVVVYDDYSKQIIMNLKYKNHTYLARNLAILMKEKIMSKDYEICFDYIVPVPLHAKRYRKRGYNQAALIAKHLSEMTSLPMVNALKRVKSTQALNKLDRDERESVIKGAFDIHESIKGNVILVDDIFTTGMTVNECANVLKLNGVNHILVVTFAVGEI